MRIKEQETRLTLREHDGNDDEISFTLIKCAHFSLFLSNVEKSISSLLYVVQGKIHVALSLQCFSTVYGSVQCIAANKMY